MKDLQSLIDQRAEYKLDAELMDLRNAIHGHTGLISMIDNLEAVKVTIGDKTDSFRSAFWNPSSFAFSEIKNKLLPLYKEKEVDAFLKQIDDLKQRTSELQDELSNINY